MFGCVVFKCIKERTDWKNNKWSSVRPNNGKRDFSCNIKVKRSVAVLTKFQVGGGAI